MKHVSQNEADAGDEHEDMPHHVGEPKLAPRVENDTDRVENAGDHCPHDERYRYGLQQRTKKYHNQPAHRNVEQIGDEPGPVEEDCLEHNRIAIRHSGV